MNDKFILQSKRDKEALQNRVVVLDDMLEIYEEHNKPAEGQESKVTCSVEQQQHLGEEVFLLDGLVGLYQNKQACVRNRSELNKLEEERQGKQLQMMLVARYLTGKNNKARSS